MTKKILSESEAKEEALRISKRLLSKFEPPEATFIALTCAAQTLAVSTSQLREGFNEEQFIVDTLKLFASQVADHLLVIANETPTAH